MIIFVVKIIIMSLIEPLNPFLIGHYHSPKYFCDREVELETLIKDVLNDRDVVISARRRLGKSGLILRMFDDDRIKNNYYLFYVDIYHTDNLTEFVYELSCSILDKLSKRKTIFDRFIQIVKSLKFEVSINPITSEPSFNLSLGSINNPQLTLNEIFEYIDNLDKRCLLVIDEFQQICAYPENNIEALLRGKIQQCKQSRFIFSGSNRQLLESMFNSHNKPFYRSTINLSIGCISLEKYVEFVQFWFNKNNKTIDKEVIIEVYKRFDGITWYLQLMFNELFALTSKSHNCTVYMVPIAIDNIVNHQRTYFSDLLKELSIRQKELLYAIASSEKAKGIKSAQFIRDNSLRSSSAVQSAESQLINKFFVIKDENDVYKIEDYFFEIFLKEKGKFH